MLHTSQVFVATNHVLDCLDYKARHLSLKENGMRHGLGRHEKKNRLQTVLMFLRTLTLVKIIYSTN